MNEQQLRDTVREAVAEGVQDVRAAVAAGIRDVLSDPEAQASFWAGAFTQLQKSTQQQAGRIVLGSIGVVFRKGLLFVALGLIVYSFGGWAALVKLWHALNP